MGLPDSVGRVGRDDPASGSSGTGKFVGRETELAELLDGLEAAMAGHGRLYLIGGEPGIGKSTLADRLSAEGRARGCVVLVGRCWEAGGAPAYWPWVQCLRAYLRTVDADSVRDHLGGRASDMAQMLPEIQDLFGELPPPPSTDPDSARFRLFDSATQFLTNAAREHPFVIVLDDLHAADTPSLLLLRFLAAQLSDAPVLVVATYRDVELTPEHPLTAMLPELARDPSARHLSLLGLPEAHVATFIQATTRVQPQTRLVTALHRETDGNPLFLGEVVRLLAAEGRLGEVSDATAFRISLPSRIRDVISRRLARLSEACTGALTHASVLGTEFSLDALGRTADMSGDDLLDALDEAVRAGLVAEAPGALARFRFSHDLVREALYEGIGSAQRVRLHRRVAEALEQGFAGDTESHLAELAHHFFEAARAGDVGTAVDYARRAGDRAAASLAYEEAARLYQMALQALELEAALDERLRGGLMLALGDAQARAGDFAGAQETSLRAAGVARQTGATEQLALAALGYGGRFVYSRAGSDPHLIPLLQDALVLLGGGDDRLRVRLLARLACALRSSPDRDLSAALSQQALDLARGLADPPTLAYALDGRFAAIWWPENPEQRLEIAQELLAAAAAAGDLERVVGGRMAAYTSLAELGRMAEARAELEALARSARELRQPAQRWLFLAVGSLDQLMQGDFDSAEAGINEALRVTDPHAFGDVISAARFQSFLLRREQDRLDEMEQAVRAAIEEFPWYPGYRAALACLLLELDRADEARTVFDDLARDEFRALYRDNQWLLGMALASDACAMLRDTEAAAVLCEQLRPFDGRNALGIGEGSVGAVDRYLGLLATTLGRLEEAERHYSDAIAVNERMGARPWAAHSRHDLATMLLSRDGPGDRERAEALLASALTTAEELGMVALRGKIVQVLGEPSEAPAPSTTAPRANTFRREGEYWSVSFEGEAFRLKDSKGLRYVARLLASPGREFHVLDLVAGVSGARREELPSGHAGEILDSRAKEEYRRRLMELEQEISEAEGFGDTTRAERAKGERDLLVQELSSAVGLGGRDRRAASATERARVSVTRAIRSALARVREHSAVLGRHLEATVRTGTFCSYSPDPRLPVSWKV